MTLYTSYFGKRLKGDNLVSIARGTPQWFTGRCVQLVAPSWDLVTGIKSGSLTAEEYTVAYVKQLDSIGVDKILAMFKDGDILLCYEKPGDFCHRHILANWLNNKGHNVTEFGGT